MRNSERIRGILRRIDGRGYGAYRELEGIYKLSFFDLSIDRVQRDPFAPPSQFCIRIGTDTSLFPEALWATRLRRIALSDYLGRQFAAAARVIARQKRGTGNSGSISINAGSQQVLERNSVVFTDSGIETRFLVGLPASGRRVLSRQAEEMILGEIPKIVGDSLLYRSLKPGDVDKHVCTVEDQAAMRSQLPDRGLVAFIANGSVLPRRTGIDDRPLLGQEAVPFCSPPELSIELSRPTSGPISGMGIPRGVNLIVGGGYHGKSTLLRAIERGVYDHIPGDGREWVVTDPSAAKIRAEDGRSVQGVDISAFIGPLPFGIPTDRFSTENASGSTSQAANIGESIEAGARLLLIDEDTSATNFIIRDARMQALVMKENEPITPLIDRVRQIYRSFGVSTIMVVGGSGDYFDVADQVIMMKEYLPTVQTKAARRITVEFPSRRRVEAEGQLKKPVSRVLKRASLNPSRGDRAVRVAARGLSALHFGTQTIDLSNVEQLVDPSQTRAIGHALVHLYRQLLKKELSVSDALILLEDELDRGGLDALTRSRVGDLARPRPQETAAALNRLRSLKIY